MEDLFLAPCWKHVRHSGRGDQWTWARFRVKSYNRPNKGKGLAAGGTSCTHIPFQPKQSSHWLHLSWERIKNPAVTHRVPGKKAEHSSFGKKKETKAMECYQSLSVSSLFLLTWLYGSWWDKTPGFDGEGLRCPVMWPWATCMTSLNLSFLYHQLKV